MKYVDGVSGEITLSIDDEIVDRISLANGVFVKPAIFKPVLNEREEKSLREQLKSYEKLLELEPDNKCK